MFVILFLFFFFFFTDTATTEIYTLSLHDACPIGMDHLRSLPETEWPAASLRAIPALKVVESDWPLHVIWRDGGDVAARTTLRVWRQDGAVYHCALDPLERAALERLCAGASFGEICGTLADLD